jgi:ribosomal subunit interface protein
MKINIEAIGIELTEPLESYLIKKIGVLEKIMKHFEKDGEIEVRVEISRATRHQKKGDIYRVSADVRLPKKVLRADVRCADIRIGINDARDMLRFDIEKHKERMLGKKK